jgi:hypothetical protein
MSQPNNTSLKSRAIRGTALLVGYLGLAHFAIGIPYTLWFLLQATSWSYSFRFITPYIIIASLFGMAVTFGQIRRAKIALTMALLGLAATVTMCAFDLSHGRCQGNGAGIGAQYTIWWWYYEPYWQGYEAGNT